jgi:hypothetical protein
MPSGDRIEMTAPASYASSMLGAERRWANDGDLSELDSVVVERAATEICSAPA